MAAHGHRVCRHPGKNSALPSRTFITQPWVVIGCAGSIVLSALVANFRDNRQLTTPEAWTCGLLYWIPMPYQARPSVRTKG
jgi:hypothetical protein